jgi:hypothetical protein
VTILLIVVVEFAVPTCVFWRQNFAVRCVRGSAAVTTTTTTTTAAAAAAATSLPSSYYVLIERLPANDLVWMWTVFKCVGDRSIDRSIV